MAHRYLRKRRDPDGGTGPSRIAASICERKAGSTVTVIGSLITIGGIHMNAFIRATQLRFAVAMLAGGFFIAGAALATESKVALSGAQEVPPVSSAATGSGTITVNSDKSVSGSVTTSGIAGTMAHIHEAAAG
jgi:hypothetical protein